VKAPRNAGRTKGLMRSIEFFIVARQIAANDWFYAAPLDSAEEQLAQYVLAFWGVARRLLRRIAEKLS